MNHRAIIFGAGKTGRGLAGWLCPASGIPIALVDREAAVATPLKEAGRYPLQILGGETLDVTVETALPLQDAAWHDNLCAADLAFVSVTGTNLKQLGAALAPALQKRFEKNPGPLNIITCENFNRAANVLRWAILEKLPPSLHSALKAHVGFVEAMVLTTSLSSDDPARPLLVRSQNYLRLPCDAAAFVGPAPQIKGLEPLEDFENQLQRKIFTYNSINAVISYLGAERGYENLAEASRDPAIADAAVRAGDEASRALIAEYGFDVAEQKTWADGALAKFQDASIPDPISRNAADPRRKLGRDDRLVGPALLALKHGIQPTALASGIVAGAIFAENGETLLSECGSLPEVLRDVCGLTPEEPLFKLVMQTAQAKVAAK